MLTRPLPKVIRFVLFTTLFVLVSVTLARSVSVFDQLDLLVDVRHEIVSNFVEEPDQQRMLEQAVRGMVGSLNDPYTVYLSPDEFEPFDKHVRGTFSGIGAEVDIFQNRLRIVTPLEDSPAWKAGIMAGDIVLEIDGESTEDMPITECIKRLTGEEGTKVAIRVRHESGEERTVSITRARINIHTVRGFSRDTDNRWDYMLDDANHIAYVRITQFTERTVDDLRAVLNELIEADARAVILDVRFNPGGLLESAVKISDMFLEAGKRIVSVKGRVVPESAEMSTAQGTLPPIPVVVLANEASASAAEIVTGALADNGRACFIGTRTFGKGSVQQVRMLDSARGAIKITNAYYYLPSGRNIHRRDGAEVWGVDPAEGFYVPMSPQEVREMLRIRRDSDVLRPGGNGNIPGTITSDWLRGELKDPQLAAALEAAQGKLATGEWPKVGQSGVEELVKLNRRASLALQRDLLRDRLEKVEEEIIALGGLVEEDAPDPLLPPDEAEDALDLETVPAP